MGIKYFLRQHLPFFLIPAYNCLIRFLYRTVGTSYRKSKHYNLKRIELLKLAGHKLISDLTRHFKERKSPIFLTFLKKQEVFAEIFKDNFPEAVDAILQSSKKILNHTFDLLGSGRSYLGKNIDWHLDFKVNRRWPLIHPKGIDPNELKKPSDVKFPWELSRCQHLIALGKAYWLTKDEKYAKEFKNQIDSWIRDNPYGLGVNWLCTMDVAIRACNWILGWQLLKESPLLDEKFTFDFVKCLFAHGAHIMNNLENKGKVTSNHYLSDITGLLYLGFFFRNTEEGETWKNFAVSELISEMQNQVNPDGMDFEGSTCYHRLVLELFFFSTLLSVINDESFDGHYMETAKKIFGKKYVVKLYKMFEFVLYTLKPDGKMPQIGDNDNGRLYIFSDRNILDMRYLLNYGAVFFNEPRFKIKKLGVSEDLLWAFGIEGYERWKKLKDHSICDLKSKAFSDSGVYVQRDKNVHVVISCMHNGQNGNGGHNHNDALSFELNFGGRDFIVDPGTYNYTSNYKMRNLFRSTSYHNTAVINGKEINNFKEKDVFRMENEAKPKVLKWKTDDEYDLLEAEHYGYAKLPDPVIHSRNFFFDKKNSLLKIEDFIKGVESYSYEILFHFPPIPLSLENKTLKTNFPDPPNAIMKAESREEFRAVLKEGWISPSYGIKIKAPYLCYTGKAKGPLHFTTTVSFLH